MAGSTVLREGPGFLLARFRCPPGDPRWSGENWVGPDDHVVFPGPAMRIARGRSEFVATAQETMLYNRDEVYRRALLAPDGDDCVYVAVRPGLAAEMAAYAGITGDRLFPVQHVPCRSRDYLLMRRVAHRLESSGDAAAGLAVDEAVLGVLGHVMGAAGTATHSAPSGDARVALEETKALLVGHDTEPPSVTAVAGRVAYSPYHLARLFRAHTGMSMYTYWRQQRLRLSVARVLDGDERLADIASDLGFSSHSHFTYDFRRTFGVTPHALRAAA